MPTLADDVAKGLGVHAASSGYSNFRGDIGIDDEAGNNGSIAFQVWLDGVKK
jgi:beta-galactosidase